MENTTQPRATPTDEALAAEAAGGHTSSFALLVDRHAATVLAVVERSIGDVHHARDLCQEIWIKVHGHLKQFDPRRRFRPWLFAIAFNHVRDDRRKLARRTSHLRYESLSVDLSAREEDSLAQRELREQIAFSLGRVPQPYRDALHLVDVVGLDYDEAAESLCCSRGTVKSRVHRGRRAFQEVYTSLQRPPEEKRTHEV